MTLLYACEPFTTVDSLTALCSCQMDEVIDMLGSDAIDEIIDAATDFVWKATGGRVTGRCSVKVRPCSNGICGCLWPCACCNIDGVHLFGADPVVTEVKIDGVVEGPELYALIDGRVLVRTDGSSWPGNQNVALDDALDNTFSITFTHGETGFVATMATNEIACDLIEASIPGGQPKLPPGAVAAVMDGTSIEIDPERIGYFPWMARLSGIYASGPQPVIWSPEVRGRYTLHTVSP